MTKVCHVPISIGKIYQEKVTCDVLEMDVCHVILERSSPFDHNLIHSGQENTYLFVWEGRKIALLSLVPNSTAASSTSS